MKKNKDSSPKDHIEQLAEIKRQLFNGKCNKSNYNVKEQLIDPYNPNGTWRSDSNNRPRKNYSHLKKKLNPSHQTHKKIDVSSRYDEVQKVPARPGVIGSISTAPKLEENKTVPVFRPRINQNFSLKMPDWAGLGSSLQHPESRVKGGRPITIRIGLDFGTAFTKVAINAKGLAVICVDWGAAILGDTQQTQYVIPGVINVNDQGVYCWSGSKGDETRTNLKLPLLESGTSIDCPSETIAFLSLVIRYSRAYLYKDQSIGRRLIDRSLQWELNIGCPTEQNEDQKIVERFQFLARAAWQLAGEKFEFNNNSISYIWKRVCSQDWIPALSGLASAPSVVPEFVAQIAGYIGSGQAADRTYALIDIGTATLDVATFNIVIDSEGNEAPRIPIFYSLVAKLGTHFLNQHRFSSLSLGNEWDDSKFVEDSTQFSVTHGIEKDKVEKVDSHFIGIMATKIQDVINMTRLKRDGDPKSQSWMDGLPIFITGGGSASVVITEAINLAEAKLKSKIDALNPSNRFRFIRLDLNSNRYGNLDYKNLIRLTVALGLTEDADDIQQILHADIPDIEYKVKDRPDSIDLYGD